MTGPGNRRYTIWCPRCGRQIGSVRPEMLVLRRLSIYWQHATGARKVGDTVHITCECGHVHVVKWSLLQP